MVDRVEIALRSNEALLAQIAPGFVPAAIESPPANDPQPERGGLAGAVLRGQAAVARWIAVGTLVHSAAFAERWGVTRQALEQAVERGELFSIKHGNRRFYAAALLELSRADVAQVCKALGRAAPEEQLMFWLRVHGGLAGRTAVEAVAAGQVWRVTELAQDWAEERGFADAAAPGPLREA